MADVAVLKRQRAGHRAAATRRIREVNDLFIASPTPEPVKVSQLLLGLKDSLDTLNRLDNDILPLVDPGDIDREVEQSERAKDEIFAAIAKLNHAPTSTSTATAPTAGATMTRLPKLNLKSFNGTLTCWASFWDSYKATIHDNASLSDIEKFSYLQSLLDGRAGEAIAGLALTDANYATAIDILERRYGDKEKIIAAHMDKLMNLEAVSADHHTVELRRLYDRTEANIRGLEALGVAQTTYSALLTPVFTKKLPTELRLNLTRKLPSAEWKMNRILEAFLEELEARERAAVVAKTKTPVHPKRNQDTPTARAFVAGEASGCCFCQQESHLPTQCTNVVSIDERKHIVRQGGRCFNCLRRGHLVRDCRSSSKCSVCRNRHHTSLCTRSNKPVSKEKAPEGDVAKSNVRTCSNLNPNTSAYVPPEHKATNYCTGTEGVLLQMAKAKVFNLEQPNRCLELDVLFDSGSQCSYITNHACQRLALKSLGHKPVAIFTFGSREECTTDCRIVRVGLEPDHGLPVKLNLLSVPHICEPVTGAALDVEQYPHLHALEFSIDPKYPTQISPDILLGSDHYWDVMTGEFVRGRSGPVAVKTRLGWILSGPVISHADEGASTTLITHVLRVDSPNERKALDKTLRSFWDIEAIGIADTEEVVQNQFEENVSFVNGRYVVSLPWKESFIQLPDNYQLSMRRLSGLLRRLKRTPELLKKYDDVIREQIKLGIVVPVEEDTGPNRVHYIPHHAVVRQDKSTTKLRVVYDASAKSDGPSLNECLHIGPSLHQKILDILLRFRAYPIAIVADLEKAFLMIRISEVDQDVLRFLWVKSVADDVPEIQEFKFTRVVFGVAPSPYLLGATIGQHLLRFKETYTDTVQRICDSIYVDDIITGANCISEACTFYTESKYIFKQGGFNLRKFTSNCVEVQEFIDASECELSVSESEEESFSKQTLGKANVIESGEQKVLGVVWDRESDEFVINVSVVVREADRMEPTKRNIIGLVSKLYDPMGFIAPVVIRLKLFFQELCQAKVGWDEPLTTSLRERWKSLLKALDVDQSLRVPRCYPIRKIDTYTLVGFCDASLRAYAAVVYLADSLHNSSFVVAKTRVAPIQPPQTIPRLELLGAVLLARLMTKVSVALSVVEQARLCFTDSSIVLHWIKGLDKAWKPFVQNRIREIREKVPSQYWYHCRGKDNPADLPSRGSSLSELKETSVWLNGPSWLKEFRPTPVTLELPMPVECLEELRAKEKSVLSLSVIEREGIGVIMAIERFSSYETLIAVTVCVLSAIDKFQKRILNGKSSYVKKSERLWIREAQRGNIREEWKRQFMLFEDESGVWRCRGRLGNADMPYDSLHPILLPRDHPFTLLVVRRAHQRVVHSGTKDTLTELRSRYWIPRGRALVHQYVNRCVICRRFAASSYKPPAPPPLPNWRVQRSFPFSTVGVDYAGPLVIKCVFPNDRGVSQQHTHTTYSGEIQNTFTTCHGKAWVCLFTCCSTRAVHLDIVTDLSPPSFLKCFKRFISRRGLPTRIISDNGSTFKASAKVIKEITNHPEVKQYLDNSNIYWTFNIERAPWWGGFFERMVQLLKRCLRKMVGKATLTYEELLTEVTEVELVLNSRPLTYLSATDMEEPVTPSHLIFGKRLASLPDHFCYPDPNDEDFNPNPIPYLTKRMQHLNTILDHFWNRWRREYLLELRERHRQFRGGNPTSISIGDIVIIHDDSPRGMWKIGVIEKTITGRDGETRGAIVRVKAGQGSSSFLRRPIQKLFPLEVHQPSLDTVENTTTSNEDSSEVIPSNGDTSQPTTQADDTTSLIRTLRPRRQAAAEARDRIVARLM